VILSAFLHTTALFFDSFYILVQNGNPSGVLRQNWYTSAKTSTTQQLGDMCPLYPQNVEPVFVSVDDIASDVGDAII
jgi:hypothetical protein